MTEAVSEKIASQKASEAASTKAPPTVEKIAYNMDSVEDDAQLMNQPV